MQLTVRAAAQFLGVSETTLYRWLRRGEVPAQRIDDQYRFDRVELLEWAASRGIRVPAEMLLERNAPPLEAPTLAEVVTTGGVHLHVAGTDKPAIFRAMVELLPLPAEIDRDFLYQVLLSREAIGSTGFGNGIAIPHPRNPIVLQAARPAVAICYLERPIDFDALDGKPVHTLCTLVSPSIRTHLHLLAVLAAVIQDPAMRARLEARTPAAELIPAIARAESELAQQRAANQAP